MSPTAATAWLATYDQEYNLVQVAWGVEATGQYDDWSTLHIPGADRKVFVHWGASGYDRTSWRHGRQRSQASRVASIEVCVGDCTPDPYGSLPGLVRKYHFAYENVPFTGPFVLRRVAVTGKHGLTYDGVAGSALPTEHGAGNWGAVEITHQFEYLFDSECQGTGECDHIGFDALTASGAASAFQRVREEYFYGYPGHKATVVDTVDMNGDGIPDIVDTRHALSGDDLWVVQLGNADGTYDPPSSFPGAPYPLETPTLVDAGGQVCELHEKDGTKCKIDEIAGPIAKTLKGPIQALLLDMNGDGLPDLFDGETLYLNTGERLLPLPWDTSTAPPPEAVKFELQNLNGGVTEIHSAWSHLIHEVQGVVTRTLIDFDGDSCPDLVDGRTYSSGYWRVYRSRLCDPIPVLAYEAPAEIQLPVARPLQVTRSSALRVDKPVGFLEINGDGVLDWFVDGAVFLGTGNDFEPSAFDSPESTLMLNSAPVPNVDTGEQHGFVDLNGDGLPDYVKSNGDPRYVACLEDVLSPDDFPLDRMEGENWYPHTSDNPQMFVEFDICHCVDAVGHGDPHWTVMFNTGDGWASEVEWQATRDGTDGSPALGYIRGDQSAPGCGGPGDYGHTRLSDVNGDGTLDFVRGGGQEVAYNRLTSGRLLLTKWRNERGGAVHFAYRPYTSGRSGTLADGFGLPGESAPVHEFDVDVMEVEPYSPFALPLMVATDSLHFPVWAATTKVLTAGVAGSTDRESDDFYPEVRYVTEVERDWPTYDRWARVFRGFRVTQTRDYDHNGTTLPQFSEAWFYAGSENRALVDRDGMLLPDRAELAGRPFRVTSYLSSAEGQPSTPHQRTWSRYAAYGPERGEFDAAAVVELYAEETEEYASFGTRARLLEYQYDAYGNLESSYDHGETDRDASTTADAEDDVLRVRTFTADEDTWRVGLLTSETARDVSGAVLEASERHYDTNGQLTLRRDAVEGDGPTITQWADWNYTGWGPFGTLRQLVDPEGNTTDICWGDQWLDGTPCPVSPGDPSYAYPLAKRVVVAKGRGADAVSLGLTRSSDRVPHMWEWSWDEQFGRLRSEVAPSGVTLRAELDDFGRVVLMTRSTGAGSSQVLRRAYRDGVVSIDGLGTCIEERRDPGDPEDDQAALLKWTCQDGFMRPFREQVWSNSEEASATTMRRWNYQGQMDVESLPYFSILRPDFGTYTGGLADPFYEPEFFLDFKGVGRTGAEAAVKARESRLDGAGRVLSTWLRGEQGVQTYHTVSRHDGWRSWDADPLGNETGRESDVAGRTVVIEQCEGTCGGAGEHWSTWYEYDPAGQLVSINDDQGNLWRNDYDLLGRKVAALDPDLSNCGQCNETDWTLCPCVLRFAYDGVGNLASTVDAKGQLIEHAYDELGREWLKTFGPRGAPEETFVWLYDDDVTGALSGVLAAHSGASALDAERVYTYDGFGRVSAETVTVQGRTLTTTFAYDNLDRPVLRSSSSGHTFLTEYVGADTVRSDLKRDDDGKVLASTRISGRDAMGRITSYRYGDFGSADIGYDPVFEKVESVKASASSAPVTYAYLDDGNVHTVTGLSPGYARTYTYDWAGRLTHATDVSDVPGAPDRTWAWTYDSVNNMLTNSDWAQQVEQAAQVYGLMGDGGTYYYEAAGPHAVTRVGGGSTPPPDWPYVMTYDANGAMTNRFGKAAYTYNHEGRLRQVTELVEDQQASGVQVTTLSYNAAGDRVYKLTGGPRGNSEVTYFGPNVEYVDDADGARYVLYLDLQGSRMATVDTASGTVRYMHADPQGSVTVITDANGTELARRLYAPYGEMLESGGALSSVRYGFTGGEHDFEIGQVHLGVRQYDPNLARWLQPDVVLIPDNPMTLNRYAYVYNNPVRYTDPSGYCVGRCPWWVAVGVQGGFHAIVGGEASASVAIQFVPDLKVAVMWSMNVRVGPGVELAAGTFIAAGTGELRNGVDPYLRLSVNAGLWTTWSGGVNMTFADVPVRAGYYDSDGQACELAETGYSEPEVEWSVDSSLPFAEWGAGVGVTLGVGIQGTQVLYDAALEEPYAPLLDLLGLAEGGLGEIR